MTDHPCEECGGEVQAKNTAGHYRDKCVDCRLEAVADRLTHRDECDDPDCSICNAP